MLPLGLYFLPTLQIVSSLLHRKGLGRVPALSLISEYPWV